MTEQITTDGRINNISLAHDMARKENARFCAERGLHLVCRDHKGTRQSIDLDPEQPVLVNGDTLCFATGYEEDGQYELFLGSVFGPRLYVKKVRAMTRDNFRHLRAKYLADALADELMRLRHSVNSQLEKTFYRAQQDKAEEIMGDLLRH